jgi:hypothetical protein
MPYNHRMTAAGDGYTGTFYASDYKRMGRETMLARARRGFTTAYLGVAFGLAMFLFSLLMNLDNPASETYRTDDQVPLLIGIALLLIYGLITHRMFLKHGTRSMVSTCAESTLAEARRAVAASGIIPQLLAGKLAGREHLRYFPLTTLQHIGSAVTPELRLRRAVESMSYNCKWYLKRRGMCRGHLELLPWAWFYFSPFLMLAVVTWLSDQIVRWCGIAAYVTFWLGLAGFIYLRLRLNNGAGCYELAFYDELAEVVERSATPPAP